MNTEIPILRKRADEACQALAKIVDECPDTIWAEATKLQFPKDEWGTADNNNFWEAFITLHQAEKAAVAEFSI